MSTIAAPFSLQDLEHPRVKAKTHHEIDNGGPHDSFLCQVSATKISLCMDKWTSQRIGVTIGVTAMYESDPDQLVNSFPCV